MLPSAAASPVGHVTTFLNGAETDGDAVTTSHFRPAQASNRAVEPPGVAREAFGKSRQPISSTLIFAGPAPSADAIPIKARTQHEVIDWFGAAARRRPG